MKHIDQVIIDNTKRAGQDILDHTIGRMWDRYLKAYQLLDQAEELGSADTRILPNRHFKRNL